jgi:hypothetical protein
MKMIWLCVLIATWASVAAAAQTDPREAPVCEDEPSADAAAFTCSPCPPFALGRSVCCVALHACCSGIE